MTENWKEMLDRASDEAVSPVIAVILMVAITVVLAATVYVWVSGFGASGGAAPAKTISLTSAGAISAVDCDATTGGTQYCKSYIIASASPGLKYSDITLTLDGTTLAFAPSACATNAVDTWAACAGPASRASSALVTAGDKIEFEHSTATSPSGLTLRVLDPASNSVIMSLVVS